MMRRFDTQTLRAALWTVSALRATRRQLRTTGLERLELPRPPEVGPNAERGVRAALRRRRHTCLERAIVLQRWYASYGDRREVVIGVLGNGDSFRAHAWLDPGEDAGSKAFRELRRIRP